MVRLCVFLVACSGAAAPASDDPTKDITRVVAQFVDPIQSQVTAGQALFSLRVTATAFSATGKDLTNVLPSSAGFRVRLWDRTNDSESPVALFGNTTTNAGASIDATFSDLVVDTPGTYRLALDCFACTEVTLSEPFTVVAAPTVTLKTAFVTCNLATSVASLFAGANESTVDANVSPIIDGSCTTTTSTGQGSAGTSRSLGTASCSGPSGLNVSCDTALSECFQTQAGANVPSGSLVTLAWTGGVVPAGQSVLPATQAIKVDPLPLQQSRTSPMSITFSGGVAPGSVLLTINQSSATGFVSTVCSVPSQTNSLTVPTSVLARFSPGAASLTVENTTTQTLFFGAFQLTAKLVLSTTGSSIGNVTLQ